MGYCNFKTAPLFEKQESELNKKLNKLFPSQTITESTDPELIGVNQIYKKLRESESFKDWFGDWTTKDGIAKIWTEVQDRAILDPLNEPVLYKDPAGHVYIRNIHNDWFYIDKNSHSLTPKEQSDMVNSLTAEFILDGSVTAKAFVKQRIESALAKAEEELDELNEQLDYFEDFEEQEEFERDVIGPVSERYVKLEELKGNDVVQDILSRRIVARLEKYHFKYDETADSKMEDVDNHNEIANFIKDSTESTNRAINDPQILQFMSAIPTYENFKENISEQSMRTNTLLGTPLYMAQGEAWRLLETYLSDMVIDPEGDTIDMFEVFKEALNQAVKDNEHPGLNYMLNFLENVESKVSDPESFKTKFVSAFYMAKQSFLITQTEITSNKKGEYNLEYTVIDPSDMTAPEITLANTYVNALITDQKMLKADVGRVNEMRNNLIELFKDAAKVRTYDSYYNFLNDLFNEHFEMGVPVEAIKYYINKRAKVDADTYDFTNIKKDVNKFLSDQIMNKEVLKATKRNAAYSGQFSLVSELKGSLARKNSQDNLDTIKNFLYSNNSLLRYIGEASAIYSEDVSESSILLSSGKQWGYSYMSGLHRKILQWRNGNLTDLMDLSDRNLFFVDHIIANPSLRDMLRVYTNAEIRKSKDNNPTPHKKITELDYHIENMMKMFNSRDGYLETINENSQKGTAQIEREINNMKNYLLYNFGADKNSLFALFGLPDISRTFDLYDTETGEIRNDMKRLLNGYVKGELTQLNKAAKIIAGYTASDKPVDYMMKHMIPGYHYKLLEKGDALHRRQKELESGASRLTPEELNAGSYTKLGIFSEAFNRYQKESGTQMLFTESSFKEVKPAFLSEDANNIFGMNDDFQALMYHVYDVVNESVAKDFKYINEVVLVNKENEETGELMEVKMKDIGSNINLESGEKKIYNYVLNSFLIGYEFSNIFNGHIGFYKQSGENTDISDFLKRAPAAATNGNYLRMRDSAGNKTYTTFDGTEKTIDNKDTKTVVAIANNIELSKSQHDAIIQKASGNNLSMAHELADAQGYITAEHFRDILERTSGWEAIDTVIHNRLMDPTHKVNDEDIKWIRDKNKSYTPLKLVYYGIAQGEMIDDVQNMTMPVYLKYSLAPLFPAMIGGTQMELILNKMNDQGVEQLVFQSGSKAANHAPTTIHNITEEGLYGGVDPEARLNPFTIDTSELKIQTEVPTKLDKDTLLGFQSLKNILTNLALSSNSYTHNNKRHSGQEIYDMVNNVGGKLLNIGMDKVLKAVGYDSEQEGIEQFDVHRIKKLLVKQMDIETEQDLIQMLDTDLPMETVPNFGQRAFPVLSSYVKDTAGKIYTNGGSMVQVANVGYDKLFKKGASDMFFFDKNNTELKPPLPRTNKEGEILYFDSNGLFNTKEGWGEKFDKNEHKMQIAKAKILLPFTSVFGKSGLSYEEFIELYKKGDKAVNRKIFETIMGYRIPNQAMSSNDSFEIIGLLPPLAGDQAVVYHEITAKTGSDFDIDKMYLAMPNIKVTREYTMLDEDKRWFEHLKKRKPQVAHLEHYMERYEFDKGSDILNLFSNDKEAERVIKSDPAYTEGRPVKAILNKQDELIDIFETNNSESIVDGEPIEYLDVLDDLIAAHSRQVADAREVTQEMNDQTWAYKKEHSFQKVTGIEYVTGDSKRGLQNEFVELMISILESPDSYNDLVSPLDNDIVKDTINKISYLKTLSSEEREAFKKKPEKEQNKLVKTFTKEAKPNAIEQMFPVHLLKSRADVLEAKTLIAIMANNMTDIGESQKSGFALKYDLGLGRDKGIMTQSMARIYQLKEDGNSDAKLSKLISYFMNASVDAAKDNYIISGNINSYSANSALMMARLGINLDDILTITMNESIMKHSRLKNFQKSKNADFNLPYTQKELDQWSQELLFEMSENKFDLWSVIDREDFLADTENKQQKILGFWNIIQTMGKEFNNAVVAMKSESNGSGKNIAEMISLRNRIERVKYDAIENNFEKWNKKGLNKGGMKLEFNPDARENENMKILGTMANNTLFFMEHMSRHLFIEATDQARNSVNAIMSGMGQPLSTDATTIRMIQNYMYPYLLYKSGNPIFNLKKSDEKKLMQEFPIRLHKYRMKRRNNKFLRQLRITVHGNENLIIFPSSRSFSNEDRGNFKQDIMEIMNDTRTGEYAGLVDQMVQYAFLTTGFKSTYYSFNDYLPASYFINKDHGIYVKKMIQGLNQQNESWFNPELAFTMMAQVNHKNFKIVKSVPMSKYQLKPSETLTVTDEKVLTRLETENFNYAPFFRYGQSLYMKIGEAENGYPQYKKIDAVKNKKFNMYPFYDTPEGLSMDSVTYRSETDKLYNNIDIKKIQAVNPEVTKSEKTCKS